MNLSSKRYDTDLPIEIINNFIDCGLTEIIEYIFSFIVNGSDYKNVTLISKKMYKLIHNVHPGAFERMSCPRFNLNASIKPYKYYHLMNVCNWRIFFDFMSFKPSNLLQGLDFYSIPWHLISKNPKLATWEHILLTLDNDLWKWDFQQYSTIATFKDVIESQKLPLNLRRKCKWDYFKLFRNKIVSIKDVLDFKGDFSIINGNTISIVSLEALLCPELFLKSEWKDLQAGSCSKPYKLCLSHNGSIHLNTTECCKSSCYCLIKSDFYDNIIFEYTSSKNCTIDIIKDNKKLNWNWTHVMGKMATSFEEITKMGIVVGYSSIIYSATSNSNIITKQYVLDNPDCKDLLCFTSLSTNTAFNSDWEFIFRDVRGWDWKELSKNPTYDDVIKWKKFINLWRWDVMINDNEAFIRSWKKVIETPVIVEAMRRYLSI